MRKRRSKKLGMLTMDLKTGAVENLSPEEAQDAFGTKDKKLERQVIAILTAEIRKVQGAQK